MHATETWSGGRAVWLVALVSAIVMVAEVGLVRGLSVVLHADDAASLRLSATHPGFGLLFALLPFIGQGVVLMALYASEPQRVGRLYLADLAGAAAGLRVRWSVHSIP